MSLPHTDPSPFDLVRPFVWLAVFAFLVGFATYMLYGVGSVGAAYSRAPVAAPIVSQQVDWDSRKAI